MTMKEASANAKAAVNALQAIGSICADLAPLDMPMTDEQIRQRATPLVKASDLQRARDGQPLTQPL